MSLSYGAPSAMHQINLDTANNSISQATFHFIDPVPRLFEMSSFLDVTPNQKRNREVHFVQFESVRFLRGTPA